MHYIRLIASTALCLVVGCVGINYMYQYGQPMRPLDWIIYFLIYVGGYWAVSTQQVRFRLRNTDLWRYVPFAVIFGTPVWYNHHLTLNPAAFWYNFRLSYWMNAFLVNVAAGLITVWDKELAERKGFRIPEDGLHDLVLYGGWGGSVLAQCLRWHKINSNAFLLKNAKSALLHYAFAIIMLVAMHRNTEQDNSRVIIAYHALAGILALLQWIVVKFR